MKVEIPESAIVNACLRWLWMHGCFVWRCNTGGMKDKRGQWVKFGRPGQPDIQGMTKNGRYLGVECKSAKGKLSDHQIKFGDQIVEHNGIHILARSIDDLEARREEILHA